MPTQSPQSISPKKPILIVFAAGKGTRMQPLTLTKPKPLMDVNGVTLLEKNIEKFTQAVDKIVIVVGYLGNMIQDHIGTSYNGVPVEYVEQKNPKGGTLDAFRTALFYGNKNDTASGYIVTNADDIHEEKRYIQFLNELSKNSQKAVIVAAKIDDVERLKSLGVVTVDSKNNLIEIIEKPEEFVSNLANVGMYYFPANVRDIVDKKLNEKTDDEHFITRDLIQPYSLQNQVFVLPTDANWFMISTPQDLENARKNDK